MHWRSHSPPVNDLDTLKRSNRRVEIDAIRAASATHARLTRTRYTLQSIEHAHVLNWHFGRR